VHAADQLQNLFVLVVHGEQSVEETQGTEVVSLGEALLAQVQQPGLEVSLQSSFIGLGVEEPGVDHPVGVERIDVHLQDACLKLLDHVGGGLDSVSRVGLEQTLNEIG
jgi:hypothetical protein